MTEIVQSSLRLKADMLTFTVIELRSTNLEALAAELSATVSRAPRFFEKAPVVIDVREINANALNLAEFMTILKSHRIIPVGVKGLSESQEEAAHACGLVCFQSSLAGEPAKPSPSKPAPAQAPARIITRPVRAGTTIYAKNQDLIVIAPVNVGAECIADGNIHVYGPLRGRALAGASGDPHARIFCQALEAELVAIAGHYQVRDSLKLPESKSATIQVFLRENKLVIEAI